MIHKRRIHVCDVSLSWSCRDVHHGIHHLLSNLLLGLLLCDCFLLCHIYLLFCLVWHYLFSLAQLIISSEILPHSPHFNLNILEHVLVFRTWKIESIFSTPSFESVNGNGHLLNSQGCGGSDYFNLS